MVATGIDVHGKEHEFRLSLLGHLYCSDCQLVSLKIPERATHIWCYNNQLTELIIPEGAVQVDCIGNKITHLDIPNSLKHLDADKEVTGLEKCIGTGFDIRLE